jgi:Ser/Thr protein kinase RdoA (MazF antagonist)
MISGSFSSLQQPLQNSSIPATMSDEKQASDEELRKLWKPTPSAEHILLALQGSYIEPGRSIHFVKDLESYDDRNFWIEVSGRNYLAKVHNGVESRDFIELNEKGEYKKSVIHLQNTIMEHLNKNGITTSIPESPIEKDLPIPAAIRSLPVASSEHSTRELVVRLLGWVDGTPMSSAKILPLEALADAGRFLGRMSQKLRDLDTDVLAAAKRFHQWDGKHTMGLKNFVRHIPDPRRQALVESVLAAFQRDILDSKVCDTFQKSIIHGDFNDANILVDSNFFVSGVIDFGDSVESWRILDLTVAMAYSMLSVYAKNGRCISAAAAFLRGYNAVSPITEEERKHLILLIACRLSCSVTLGAYSYQQNPDNKYLLLHSLPAWDALDLIWGSDDTKRAEIAKVLNKMFALACTPLTDPNSEVINCHDLSFPDPGIGDPMEETRVALTDDATRRAKGT